MRQKAEAFAETTAADVCEPDGFCGRNDVKTSFGAERKGSPVRLYIWQTGSENFVQNACGITMQAAGEREEEELACRHWHCEMSARFIPVMSMR